MRSEAATREAGALDNFVKMFNVPLNRLGKTSAALILTLAARLYTQSFKHVNQMRHLRGCRIPPPTTMPSDGQIKGPTVFGLLVLNESNT